MPLTRCDGSDAEVEKGSLLDAGAFLPIQNTTALEQLLAEKAVTADRDDLVTKAIDYVRQSQRCSRLAVAAAFPHRLPPRAAALVDELEEAGRDRSQPGWRPRGDGADFEREEGDG